MAEARLEFLKASALHYTIKAPSLAAHLMQQCVQVAEENGLPCDKALPIDACSACGTISRVDREASEKSSMQFIKCAACYRETRRVTSKSQGSHHDMLKKSNAMDSVQMAVDPPGAVGPRKSGVSDTTRPPNTVVKQRSKSRKRGGLQALVQRSRSSQSTSFKMRLNLMDLLKAD